ncbi:MAG: DUF6316 family protein [Pseudomonadota bacterium]
MQRASDTEPVPKFRTDRYFTIDGFWYFATREQVDFGPFATKLDARRATARYIDTQHTLARLRSGDAARGSDGTFAPGGVAQRAKEVRSWSVREIGRVRGDDRRMDNDFGDGLD